MGRMNRGPPTAPLTVSGLSDPCTGWNQEREQHGTADLARVARGGWVVSSPW